MSLYGDYKAGLMTDSEYTRACADEYREEQSRDWDEEEFIDDEIDEF